MDYLQLTAPCGLDCFNCHFYLAHHDQAAKSTLETYSRLMGLPLEVMLCRGCRDQQGVIKLHQVTFNRPAPEPCRVYACTAGRGLDFCHACQDFPCDHLHPCADRADKVPHNTKVFNLCLIKKMGVETWAREKAGQVRETYFHRWWTL
jgi:hypothetical protein